MFFSTSNLSIGYRKSKRDFAVQCDLNVNLNRGELVCLIGKNGCGKSTFLRTLAGLQPALVGKILLENRLLQDFSATERAKKIAMVLTDRVEVENTTIRSLVQTGRQPHTSWWGTLSENDEEKVQNAIDLVHIAHKSESFIAELSDGERQRAMIAKALAQDTPLILLDEPTAHLDLPNRVEIMLLLHRLAHETDKAILLSTHELDLALQFADMLWLMSENAPIICGKSQELAQNGSLNHVFDSKNYQINVANRNFFVKI